MKALFQKRWFLILLCAVVVCGSLLVNTRVGLGREAGKVTAKIYAEKPVKSAAAVLSTVRSGVSALGAIADQSEIDSALQEIDQALALLGSDTNLSTQLSAYCEALDVPVALAKLNGLDAAEAESAIRELESALSARADAQTLQHCYSEAQKAGDSLLTALGSAELSESQRERVTECGELLQRLRRDIAGSAYNQAVYDFMIRNAGGWTRLCANLAGVQYPALIG